MRRSTLALSIVSLFIIPVSALALATSPAALMRQMTFNGNPHTVQMELHARAEDTTISVWVKSAGEGKTPRDMKAWGDVTVDIAGDGTYVRAKGAIRIARGNAYLKLQSLEGNTDDMAELQQWTKKPWVKIAIPESAAQEQSFAAGFAAGMRDTDIDISEEDVRALLDALADALFTMEHTRFQGGVAYSLRLAPGYLRRALEALESSAIGQKLEWDVSEMEIPLEQPMNVHIRANTNSIGELTFLKWYAATEAQESSFVIQGNAQWLGHPVYVEIPKDTVPFEELLGNVEDMMDGSSLPAFDRKLPMMEEEETGKEESRASEETAPAQLPRRVPREPVRIRPLEAQRRTPGCTATPGTPFYLQQTRKGLCDLPARSEYRVNDDGLGKALNPRTTRLKNYY